MEKRSIYRLDKNENYWKDGRPYLDRIVGRFVPDASTAPPQWKRVKCFAAYNAVSNVEAVRLNKEKTTSQSQPTVIHDQSYGIDRVQHKGRSVYRRGGPSCHFYGDRQTVYDRHDLL